MSDAIKPDLVERLRMDSGHGIQPLCEEAAAAIEALRAERDAAREALTTCADVLARARAYAHVTESGVAASGGQAIIEMCDEAIRAALAAKEQP